MKLLYGTIYIEFSTALCSSSLNFYWMFSNDATSTFVKFEIIFLWRIPILYWTFISFNAHGFVLVCLISFLLLFVFSTEQTLLRINIYHTILEFLKESYQKMSLKLTYHIITLHCNLFLNNRILVAIKEMKIFTNSSNP